MREVRNLAESYIVADDSRTIEGYAVVFNSESIDLGGFTEIIDKDALNGIIETSDVFCYLNHDEKRGVLARSNKGKGSLLLEIDEKGLKYAFDAPKTSLGDELLEGIKRGDISASSFAFACAEDKWEKRSDGSYLRHIKKIKALYDVSPVYTPAYNATTVDKRGLNKLKEKEKKELDIYYKELEEKMK